MLFSFGPCALLKNLRKNFRPPHLIPPLPPLKLSTVEYPFLLLFSHSLVILMPLLTLTLGCFIIEGSHLVRIILTNNHIKFQTLKYE